VTQWDSREEKLGTNSVIRRWFNTELQFCRRQTATARRHSVAALAPSGMALGRPEEIEWIICYNV
jgi:hypothetical protein